MSLICCRTAHRTGLQGHSEELGRCPGKDGAAFKIQHVVCIVFYSIVLYLPLNSWKHQELMFLLVAHTGILGSNYTPKTSQDLKQALKDTAQSPSRMSIMARLTLQSRPPRPSKALLVAVSQCMAWPQASPKKSLKSSHGEREVCQTSN